MLKTLHPIGNGIFSNPTSSSDLNPSTVNYNQYYHNHHFETLQHASLNKTISAYLRELNLALTDPSLNLSSKSLSFTKFTTLSASYLVEGSVLSKESKNSDPSLLMNGFLRNAPLPVMFVKALYDYDADDQTSLSFREGDIIQVITQLESGWWDGVINGVRGWFPSNYCQIIRNPKETTGENSNGLEMNIREVETDENETVEEYEDHYVDNGAGTDRGDFAKLAKEGNKIISKDHMRANFWIPQATSDGRLFYFNTETGESSTELPFDSPLVDEKPHHQHQKPQHHHDRTKIDLSDKAQNPSEVKVQGRSLSDIEDVDKNPTPELEEDYLKSRQRSHATDKTSPSKSMDPTSDNLLRVQSHREPTAYKPNSLLNIETSSAALSLNNFHESSPNSSLYDPSASYLLTWNRLVANMKKAVDRYRDAINRNERSSYVHRAEDISDHLRLLLTAGSGTTDNHSGQPSIISTNKALYPHFRDMMSKFSKLVISSHIAAADWPNAESHQKCLQEADRVLLGVLSYVEVARKQRGENLLRLLPGFVMGTTKGGNWKNNGLGMKDPSNLNFSSDDEVIGEPLVSLDSNLSEHIDDLKRILVLQIRNLDENLTLTEKIVTSAQHELIGNNVCAAAKRIVDYFKQWISIVESINLSSLGNSCQNPQLMDFAALKQGLYDSISDLLMSCQAVASPLADEWAETRGEPLEARLTHVRLCAKLLETKISQVDFSLQLLGEQIQMAHACPPVHEGNSVKAEEPRKSDGITFARSHHKRNDSRLNSFKQSVPQLSNENDNSGGYRKSENSIVRKFFGEDLHRRDQALPPRPEQAVVHVDETPHCLRLDHEDDISYDLKSQPPQLKGGTLVALVEQLTRHDKLDSNFNNTFLLTYRSFTTARDLFVLLVQRFQIQPPEGIAQAEYEMWRDRKQKPIRFRVVNILKSWLDNFWMEDQSEETKSLIRDIFTFARDTVKTTETPGSTPLMSVLEQRLRGQDTTAKRLVLNMNQTTPQPIMPKNMKKLKFLDIDPTEFARQLTILESKLYGKIKPTECLNKTWQKKISDSDAEPAPNVKALIFHSNQLTNWVAEIILNQLDVKKRVVAIKHFVLVADKCRQLNNYSTLTSIISALSTAPIHRLKRTWDQVPAKTLGVLESMRRLMGSTKNFGEYRESLHLANPPCLPFFGVYLTDLTFIEDGIPSILKKSTLINFAKRAKTAEVIRDIQQYQNVPYALQPVPELQEYILTKMQAAGDVHEMYEKSLAVEPREREDEKIVRVLAESGFL